MSTAARQQTGTSFSSLERAHAAGWAAQDNRGQDVIILDLRQETPLFDYFVLATGTSRRQLHAMSEEIDRVLEQEMGDHRMGIEGYSDSHWILLDYGDLVVHLFDRELRQHYDLENLWGTSPKIPLKPRAVPPPHASWK